MAISTACCACLTSDPELDAFVDWPMRAASVLSGAAPSSPRAATSAAISKPSRSTTWYLASVPRERERLISRSRWQSPRCLAKRVNRIILARPAVEAGERLGFLPGTLQDKIDPYLRPLYDALYDMLDPEKVDRYLEKNVIEIAPIAFMRGRTLNDSFVILDEAQNTTSEQMKMFVTRLGFNSKAVITGDVTQIDLPNARRSGLLEAMDVLKNVQWVGVCALRRSRRRAPSSGAANCSRLRRAQNASRRTANAFAGRAQELWICRARTRKSPRRRNRSK